MKLKELIRGHHGLAFVAVVEIFIILWAFVSLFGRRTVVEFDLSRADYYNFCAVSDGTLVIKQSDNETDAGTISAAFGNINLRPGRYEIEAVYKADIDDYDASKWSGGSEIPICSINVSSSTFIQQLVGGGFNIYYGTTENKEPFWINSLTKCRDLTLNITYQGYGNITIEKLVIAESLYFRFVRFFAVLLIISGINMLAYMIIRQIKNPGNSAAIELAAITFFASLPMMYRYIYVGHDLTFHVARIAQIADGIKAGNWLVKIQPDMINGYGYATPLFYPQLFLYIPALLTVLGFPLQTSYQIFVVIINFATCAVSYYAIKKVSDNRNAAVLGSFLYTLAPYRLSELYLAARLGEILSMVFFPLIIYGMYKVYKDDESLTLRKCIPLILGISGVIQSHLVSSLFVGIFIGIFVLLNIRNTFRIRRLCYLAASAVIVLMLNAWFIVPFIDSMDMDILVNGTGSLMFQGSGVYPMQIFSLFYYGKGTNVPMFASGEFCLTMGVPLITGIAVWLYVRCKYGKSEIKNDRLYKVGNITAIFAIMTIIFSLWIFPWDEINNISKTIAIWLAKIEFSWRFLSVGAAFAAFATAAGMYYVKKADTKVYTGAAACMLALTVISAGFFYADLSNGTTGAQIYSDNQTDTFALGVTNDYQLEGTDITMCRNRQIEVTSDVLTVDSYTYDSGVTTIDVINMGSDGFEKVILPLFDYPGYRAYDSGTGESFYLEAGANRRVMVNVPAGYKGTITVRYFEKPWWRLAEGVSAVTLIVIIVICCIGEKNKSGLFLQKLRKYHKSKE